MLSIRSNRTTALVFCVLFCVSAFAQSEQSGKNPLLSCTRGEFQLLLDLGSRQVGEHVLLTMWTSKQEENVGLGTLSEYGPSGDFVAQFFLDKTLRLPMFGATTTIRYIAKERLAIVLVSPQGQVVGYQVSASCTEMMPQSIRRN